jgi:murein DD-endopeptidase MepM/ murein hydrolase activator NlpD
MRRRLGAAALAAALAAAPAALAIDVAGTTAPGRLLVGTIDGESERSLLLSRVELRQRAGELVVSSTRLFRIRGLRYGFVLGVPQGAAPGSYVVRAAGEEAPVTVVAREFRRERIRLDTSLSDLMTRSDPLKDAENAELERLLAEFDVEALWHGGAFVRPVAPSRRTALYGDVREYELSDGSITVGVHRGLDLALPVGAPVVAAGAGRVVLARERIMSGNTAVIEHLPGVYSLYFHLSELTVKPGERVEAGQRIGSVGSTGLATGPHLHWEVRASGVAVDPESLLDGPQGGAVAAAGQVDRTGLGVIMAASAAGK